MSRILQRFVQTPGRRVVVDLLLEPRDVWQGLYVSPYIGTAGRRCLTAYLCLLPCVPLRISLALWKARRTWEQSAQEWED